MYMKVAVFQVPFLAKQQVAEETDEIQGRIVYVLLHVAVVGSYESIAEIPGMKGKHAIVHMEAERTEILDGKHCRGSGVALREGVYLPDARDKIGDMLYLLVFRQTTIGELLLLFDVPVECTAQVFPVEVVDRIAFEHPFTLGNVIGTDFSGMLEHALEDAAVERYAAVGIEGKGMRLLDARDIGGNLVGLLFLFFLWRTGCLALIVSPSDGLSFIFILALVFVPSCIQSTRQGLLAVRVSLAHHT